MKRYIHTEASASIPTYTGTSARARARTHTHTLLELEITCAAVSPRHTKVSSKLSLGVIILILSGE